MSGAVYAAGAVCWRIHDGKPLILVIHRTAYGDVTLPKGKVDPGESLPQTAVREVEEETGLHVTLGVPLGVTDYTLDNGREKIVHYWAAEVTEAAIAKSTFVPNNEVAALEWVSIKKARGYLSHAHDVEIVDAYANLVDQGIGRTYAIIVLRHGKTTPADTWDGPDATRPLTQRGVEQAASIVPSILAWTPKRITTSPAVRCMATLAPLAAATGIQPKQKTGISQDGFTENPSSVREVIGKRVRSRKTAVVCSHRPVLPEILRELALATGTTTGSYLNDASALGTAEFSVVHLSASNPSSGIIAIETHSPRV